jgi:hypothetical protein
LIDVANLYQKEAYHSRLQPLIEAAKANTASLAVFKPTKVIDFLWKEEERNWDEAKPGKQNFLPRSPGARHSRLFLSCHTVFRTSSPMPTGGNRRCKYWIGRSARFTGIA